ncbi:M48 family metallopeptidase [Paucibacter sp. M5-1]|uniref:M48 family metallopeptidase n=1 Tax=Paucibacter sp. M5-1 TaxID=3015998 RepID=UPI0022B8E0C5|nr:M48 family metallopeptidase [Paucibacter sp. M5-1]MCZ7884343.1 M48 family metallopeptidase [Paucibacter sp. M5-1]
MDDARFEQMVARLERESLATPRSYQLKVALLALLGLGVLALIVGIAGLGLLILAGLAVAVLLSGGKALLLLIKFGKLLILLAVPLWLLVRSAIKALFVRLPAPEGLSLQRHEAPALFAAMDQMRQRMKGPRFHQVLITDEVNAAVVQRPLLGLIGFPRNYLILGLPLLESLSPEEALAVVAHEYGHLAGSHSRFSAFIYRLRLSWANIQHLGQQWQGWSGHLLQRIVGWYAPYFNAYTFVLARANEYQADRASAELVGADVAARALKRVNLAGPQYDTFIQGTLARIRQEAMPPDDLAGRWATAARLAPPEPTARQWLQEALQRQASVHDTHPVLNLRLQALPGEAQRIDELPQPAEHSAAEVWLGVALATLRQRLGRQWRDRVQPAWSARHEELAQQAQRLAELSALPAPDREQQLTLLHLRRELEPEFDAVAGYAAFNGQYPEDSVGLFFEGIARLSRDDEQGIALLEQAIRVDIDATLPACESASAYFRRHNDEARAKAWAQRWHERHEFEQRRERERNELDPQHQLCAADLGADAVEQVRALLQHHGKGVVRAYLARRVLPSDSSMPTYVLGLQLSAWARLRKQQHAVVNALAGQDWPAHTIICVLEGRLKPLRKKLGAIAGSRLR